MDIITKRLNEYKDIFRERNIIPVENIYINGDRNQEFIVYGIIESAIPTKYSTSVITIKFHNSNEEFYFNSNEYPPIDNLYVAEIELSRQLPTRHTLYIRRLTNKVTSFIEYPIVSKDIFIKEEIQKFLSFDWKKKYSIYLESERWKVKRLKILERDNYLCQSCLTEKATEVHHLTYDRVGCELAQDLTSLCHKCHKSITAMRRLQLDDATNFKRTVYGTLLDYILSENFDFDSSETLDYIDNSLLPKYPALRRWFATLLGED